MESKAEKLKRLRELREARSFRPIELTASNVNAIFRRCMATEQTNKDDIVGNYLFSKKAGFDEDAGVFYMSESQLQKNSSEILYLIGQLYDIHNTDGIILLKNISKNYNNLPWIETSDLKEAERTIYNLIALGTTAYGKDGSPIISAIVKEWGGCAAADIMPTLSPKDPAFKAWSESEKGKKILEKLIAMKNASASEM